MSNSVVDNSSNQTPNPSPDPNPDPPIKPNVPIDVDNIKRTINVPYLQGVIKTNDFGYNPDSFQKTIYKYQKENDQTFLDHIFTDKKITNWESIKNLNVTKDDVLGSSTLSFDYGGTHNYSVNLTKNDGLLSDASYYEKMDDLSFAFNIYTSSVISGRDFPILDNNGNTIKNGEALALAGFTDKTYNGSMYTTKGTKFKDGPNQYVKHYNTSGSGWLVDYLPSNTPGVQDFYEFIVATNTHVVDLSPAFYYYRPGGFFRDPQAEVSLDPLYIKTTWGRHNGNIDYQNPNTFTNNAYVNNFNSVIDNLSFQVDEWQIGDRNYEFYKKVIKNTNRQNIPDSQAFSSWDHTIGEKASKQKQNIIDGYNFYNPSYAVNFTYSKYDLTPYWIEQIKNPEHQIEYNNIAPDISFLKVQFKRANLEAKWPKLLAAIDNNTMDEYLLPITSKGMDPTNDVSYYYAGHPYYSGVELGTVEGNHEKDNGFVRGKDNPGFYYHSGKMSPHLITSWGEEVKFNVWPNNVDVDYVNTEITSKTGTPGERLQGDAQQPNDWITLYWDPKDLRNKWAPYDKVTAEKTLLRRAFVDTESPQLNKWINKDPHHHENQNDIDVMLFL